MSEPLIPGGISAGNAEFSLSAGSHVDLSGSAYNLSVKCSDGSHIDLETFPVTNAKINLSDGSHATINVGGTLDAKLSEGSRVYYVGEPTMGEIDADWDSEVIKK